MQHPHRPALAALALACVAACTQPYEDFVTGRGSSSTSGAGGAAGASSSQGVGGSGATTSAASGGGGAVSASSAVASSGLASSSGAGGSPPACGNGVVESGEVCDDDTDFCAGCQFVCPPGWAMSASTGSCFRLFPDPPDWPNAKSWAEASMLCPAVAPSAAYVGRLAGPGVIDVLPQLGACPQVAANGTGGCWMGARCPGATCPSGQKTVALDWVGGASQPIPSASWSTGNPSGDGRCVEYIPNEGINDDACTRLEHYICEVALL